MIKSSSHGTLRSRDSMDDLSSEKNVMPNSQRLDPPNVCVTTSEQRDVTKDCCISTTSSLGENSATDDEVREEMLENDGIFTLTQTSTHNRSLSLMWAFRLALLGVKTLITWKRNEKVRNREIQQALHSQLFDKVPVVDAVVC